MCIKLSKYKLVFSFFLLIFLSANFNISAQNVSYAKQMVDTLCSDYFAGRGYVEDGMKKSAEFIANEFQQAGLTPIKMADSPGSMLQDFPVKANTFNGNYQLAIKGKKLENGIQWVFNPNSPGANGKYKIYQPDLSKAFKAPKIKNFKKTALILDIEDEEAPAAKDFIEWLQGLEQNFGIYINVTDNQIMWSIADFQTKIPQLTLLKGAVSSNAKKLSIEGSPEIINHQVQNVVGMIEGNQFPDSFIYITAHYDHLGKFGNAVYRGANDNASGVAMILDLAKHYSINPPAYSLVFVAFAAEESGLLGSKTMVEMLGDDQLPKIKFLINLDLMATGEDGIAIVNALAHPEETKMLEEIAENLAFQKVLQRDNAANSDHYPFAVKGVPAFFIYSMGSHIKAYHNPEDIASNLRYERYNDLFNLVTRFVEEISTNN